jgi:quinol monooxygenase YgiN
MVIVGGSFEVDPGRRDEFLAGRREVMIRSRAEDGCLEYTFAADPVEPGRVILFERWTSQEALDAHLAALRAAPRVPDTVTPTATSIVRYDVAAERALV